MSMHTVIAPSYEYLREWIQQTPIRFEQDGEIIYNARNQIRRATTPDGISVCIKRFCPPSALRQWIYTHIRTPKAERAFVHALRLKQLHIGTPAPIAYLTLAGASGKESYLITLESALHHTAYEIPTMPDDAQTQDLLCALAQWMATLHQLGVLHQDLSPGNILWDKVDGRWRFEVVDINRMSFKRISARMGCRNFCRLWGTRNHFAIMARAYAQSMQLKEDYCLRHILRARKRFWRHRSHQPIQYS